MFRIYRSFFKQLLFWLLFFAIGRLVFISYYIGDIWASADSFTEILMTFQKGFKLDWATASYFMFIPFIIHLIQIFFSPPIINTITKVYHWILITLYSLLISSELGIYSEWKTKINYKALLYLQNPSEVINSAQTYEMIVLLILSVLLAGLGIWLYAKFFHTAIIRIQSHWLVSLSFFLLIPPILVIGARGGIQEIPINQSQSYFSKHAIINSAATNSVFNLYISFHENQKSLRENPFEEMSGAQAKGFVKQLYTIEKDTTIHVLKQEKPNVILIIMESWSADLIFTPEDKAVVTPNFRKMMSEGLYFDHIYATGPRSEQGMASIFSGFPATPISSITVQPDKYNNLPSMVKDLNEQDYTSFFYFAGQLIYGNIKSFIIFNQFDQIKEVYDFNTNLPQGKLGIHDEFSLHEMITDLETVKEPFFSSLFTISTHSPYDQPMDETIFWGGNNQQYLNGAYYTDYSIGKFIEEAKQQAWYDNTLFIFVADHSHNSYRKYPMQNPEYQKIPLLFYGNVIDSAWRGKTIDHLGVQTDIVSTLFHQLGLDATKYPWSKNLLNPFSPQFAYTSYEEGFGWKRPIGTVSYEKRFDRIHYSTAKGQVQDSLLTEGKAFLQVLFQEYKDQ